MTPTASKKGARGRLIRPLGLLIVTALVLAGGCVERRPIFLINFRSETVYVKLNGMSEERLEAHSTKLTDLVTISGGVDVEVRNTTRKVAKWFVSKQDLKANAVDGVMTIAINGR